MASFNIVFLVFITQQRYLRYIKLHRPVYHRENNSIIMVKCNQDTPTLLFVWRTDIFITLSKYHEKPSHVRGADACGPTD
jgi:hypothetical protein